MNALSFASVSGLAPSFTAGMVLSISLIMAIGPQNAHVLRMGLQRQHLWLTVAVCALADIVLIGIGVLGLAQIGGLSDKMLGALIGAGALFLAVYGWQAFQRFLKPQTLTALDINENGSHGDAQPKAQSKAQSEEQTGAQAKVQATVQATFKSEAPGSRRTAPAPVSVRQAVLSALAFSWLNPHAWLDTAVLIGTASLAYGQGSPVFGLGAATGSLVWFLVLGAAAFWLGRRLHSLHIWRALDGAVALMMWGTAGWLLSSLVG